MVLRREIDIHIDKIIGQMLRERILGFLFVAAVLSEGFQVLVGSQIPP